MKLEDLPEDLREMDEKQFLEVVEWLKKENSKLIIKAIEIKPQLILPLRVSLGMTRTSFSRKLKINLGTLQKIENNKTTNRVVFRIWAEKCLEFLRKNPVNEKDEILKERWTIWKSKNFEDLDQILFKKLQKEFLELHLPSDLRQMNEKQFLKATKWLIKKVKSIGIRSELIKVEPQLILLFRMIIGMSQQKFSDKFGLNFKWLKSIESKRRFLEDPQTIQRVIEKISKLSSKLKIDEDLMLSSWRRFKISVHEKTRKLEKMNLIDLKKDDIIKLFNLVKEKTKNFTNLSLSLLMEESKSLLIFRLALGLGHKKFSEKLEVSERWLREKENRIGAISLQKALEIREKLEKLLPEIKGKSNLKEIVISNFEKFRKFRNNNLHPMIKNGCKLDEEKPLTDFEKTVLEVIRTFSPNKLFFHHTLKNSNNKLVNVDFLVLHKNEKFIIEVTELRNIMKNLRKKIRELDHKFRGLKLIDPKIKTVIAIKIKEENNPLILKEIKKQLLLECFDTDFLILHNELSKIRMIVEDDA